MGTGTELGRVRGLGSAHHGVYPWWHQKVTAGTNLLFMAWLVISIARMPAYDYASVRAWLSSAWVAVPMLLLVASVFYHFRLGLQVAIEDYAHAQNRVVLKWPLRADPMAGLRKPSHQILGKSTRYDVFVKAKLS